MEVEMRIADALPLALEDRRQLETWAKGKTAPARLVERARKPVITAERKAAIVRMTTQEKPYNATHWSLRRMADAAEVSPFVVWKIWKEHGLKPHLVRTLKVSNDPHFAEKVEDIVGLYLNPPEHALVFSVDEKTQIQALDRTQPGLPLKKGRCGTMTHDYKRNGTTTLFAALNTLAGTVIADTMPKHRRQEWLKFLKQIYRLVAKDKDIHIICDNYATHQTEEVQAWLATHQDILGKVARAKATLASNAKD
jgi:hypothetical protein